MFSQITQFLVRDWKKLMIGLATACVLTGLTDHASAQTSENVALARIVAEVRELNRLVFLLKQDERKARVEQDQLAKYRSNALHYANGGGHALHRAGFVAIVKMSEQSSQQMKMLQMNVPELAADNFVPEPEQPFAGGDVSQLIQFCCKKRLGLRYGSRAQLVIAELTRDLLREADSRIAELDERIEGYKSQNIAHTDLVGKLMICAQHCHHCEACFHYGYGRCGIGYAPAPAHPIAGLNSLAYDASRNQGDHLRNPGATATNHLRLKFLTPQELSETLSSVAADQVARTNRSKERSKSAEGPTK